MDPLIGAKRVLSSPVSGRANTDWTAELEARTWHLLEQALETLTQALPAIIVQTGL